MSESKQYALAVEFAWRNGRFGKVVGAATGILQSAVTVATALWAVLDHRDQFVGIDGP